MATLLGIELDAFSVRGVVVTSQLRRAVITNYLELPLAHFVEAEPTEGEVPSSPARRAVEELLRRAGRAEIVAAVSSADVSLRRVEFPAAAAKKVDELLPFEMESLVPFSAETTLLDYQATESTEPTKLRLLVCAAPRAHIASRLAELAEVGVDPTSLVPSAPALAGLVHFVPELATGTRMVVSFGVDATEVAFLREGKVELARTLLGGLRSLDEVAYGEATPGTDAERIARDLRQSLTSYRMQGGADPTEVLVTGALDPTGMAQRWLARALQRDVELVRLPDPTVGRGTLPLELEVKARFGLAAGLVGHMLTKGRRLQLRKEEFTPKRDVSMARDLAPLVGLAAACLVVTWLFSVYSHYSVLEARRVVLDAELARVTEQTMGQAARDLTTAQRLLEQGRANPDPMPRWTALDALVEVTRAIPEGMRHDVQRLSVDLALDRSEGHFELQGTVGTVDESDRVRTALAGIRCLSNLEASGATTPTADNRRLYRLEADLRCPDDPRATATTRRRRSGGAAAATKAGGN